MRSKHNFITGALILAISGIIAKSLGIFFRWPVTMLIGDEGIGLYQLAYPIYMFAIGIISGFPVAISSMVSQRIALGKSDQAYKVFKVSLFILVLIGLFSSISLYISAPYLVKLLKWREESYYSLLAISFAPLFVGIMYSYRGYFQGLQMMTMPAVSIMIEQIGRVIIGVGLTYFLLPWGINYSAAGASFGACAGALLGCLVLIFGFLKNRRAIVPRRKGGGGERSINVASALLAAAIPISLGMTVSSMMSLIDSVVVPGRLLAAGYGEKLATELYGQLTGKAHVLINVPLTLSMALGTSLVPAISEVRVLSDISRVKYRAEAALQMAVLVALPSFAGLFILADPILHLVFPGISEGSTVLQILSISVIFIILAQTLVSILHGVGDVISPVRNLAIGSVFKLVFCYILTSMPVLNINGAAVSSIIGHMIAAVLNFRDAQRRAFIVIDIDKMLLRPLLSAMVMGIGVFISYNKLFFITESNGISTALSVITGIIIYILMIIITGCIPLKLILDYIKHRRVRK